MISSSGHNAGRGRRHQSNERNDNYQILHDLMKNREHCCKDYA